jgi:hypothetical protein
MLRSAFRSLLWNVFVFRKKNEGLTITKLGKSVGVSKHEVSRWFGGDPNWTINTIGKLGDALQVSIRIEAIDRKSGRVFTPSGSYFPTTKDVTSSDTHSAPVTVTHSPFKMSQVASPKAA